MKLFLLTDDLSDGGPVWINVLLPTVRVLSECFEITHLQAPSPEPTRGPAPLARLHRWRRMREAGRRWAAEIGGALDPDGPNLLLVWAADAGLVFWSRALEPIWGRFSHRVLHVVDTMQPDHVPARDLARFDQVTCFCRDLAEAYAPRLARPPLFVPEHVDTLAFHCLRASRPLDLLLVGRRDHRHHRPLYTLFNAAERDRVFVDLVTRGQTPMTREEEIRLLMAAHAKAAGVFCYEAGAVPRFQGRSPLLSRWIHAWISGCTVFGTRPRGGGTAELMDWPEATIELPPEPREAVEAVESALSDEAGMARRRHRNVLEAVRRHDTRYRLAQILRHLDLPLPPPLETGLDRLEALAARVSAQEPAEIVAGGKGSVRARAAGG